MNAKKIINFIDKITFSFEIIIAFSLLIVIAVKIIEIAFEMTGFQLTIIEMDFIRILSSVLTLVIGVEFIRMLCKHTPETVIDVLLFAIARQMVIYQEKTFELLIGAISIAGLFAAKKFLVEKKINTIKKDENTNQDEPVSKLR